MKLSKICIAISLALSLQVHAEDYSLQNSQEADASRWNCTDCSSDGLWSGDVSVGVVGYLDNDGSTRFYNWNPPLHGTSSDISKHLNRKPECGY
ncbi:hypothetical protein P4S64_18275 [Vibrio sp. M60_M31a]